MLPRLMDSTALEFYFETFSRVVDFKTPRSYLFFNMRFNKFFSLQKESQEAAINTGVSCEIAAYVNRYNHKMESK